MVEDVYDDDLDDNLDKDKEYDRSEMRWSEGLHTGTGAYNNITTLDVVM